VPSRLAEILSEKKKEVAALKKNDRLNWTTGAPLPIRNFKGALSISGETALIAEIKFASPSAGMIRERGDPCALGKWYEAAGARAISLVTDRRFFKGNPEDLPGLKKTVSLPILRKDFILDEIQVEESLLLGADALLLIARLLSGGKLRRLLDLCRDRGLAALTEIHSREDLSKALDGGAEIIGINNRDLGTFQVNLQSTLDLVPLIPEGKIIVSESGISTAGDIRLLKERGIRAALVGTALMRHPDPSFKLRELVLAGRPPG
jgi:indole-3-glycerol phosphate synthase